MQIPILNGIYTNGIGDFRVQYPRNMVPVVLETGISKAYFRPGDGIVSFGAGPGIDRGGISWNGLLYRVMGTKLVSISSTNVVTEIGDVGGSGLVTFDYSFDYLAVASSGKFFLYKPNIYNPDGGLQQVTDGNLGKVIDFVWVDGYFMTTDGTYLVVTDLDNPFNVNPLKYGSSEADPDPIVALMKVKNEVYALNRNTIEVFNNVGGSLFPFQRVEGAQVQRGVVGTNACALFMDTVVFLGGGRNESVAVWMINGGIAEKLSTREVDQILAEYTEEQLSKVHLESRVDKDFRHLYIHLPDQTLAFDGSGTAKTGTPVWFTLTSSVVGKFKYRAQNFIWIYNKWIVGDTETNNFGYLTDTLSSHWGEITGWDFETMILYNESRGLIFHELELVALTGNAIFGSDPSIWTSYTVDGVTWSQEKVCKAGKTGHRNKRLSWLQQGRMRQWRSQRFRGTSDAQLAVARLEVRVEPLAV